MEISPLVDTLADFTLFADLSRPQLEATAHSFDEQFLTEGQRVLRQGFSGSGFYVILEGRATVEIDGQERATLSRGDFFGEVSVLLGEPPFGDVIARTSLRCLVLPGPQVEEWLLAHPPVMFRMLQAELRRLRAASTWRS